jgi:hypothetical protein
VIAKEEIGERTTENTTYRKATGEGEKRKQERKEVHLTGGTMKGRRQ